MINVLLSGFFVLIMGGIFSISFSYQGLNRAIINTPIESMFRTVEIENDGVYFDKTSFQNTMMRYYDNVIPRYAKEYNVEFYYFNLADGSMCISNFCTSVEISINCKLILNYEYSRTMTYSIRRTTNG